MRATVQELCVRDGGRQPPGLHRTLTAVDRALHWGQVAHRCSEESDMDLQGRLPSHRRLPCRSGRSQCCGMLRETECTWGQGASEKKKYLSGVPEDQVGNTDLGTYAKGVAAV